MDGKRLVKAFQLQIGGRRLFESSFYEDLVSRALDDSKPDGPAGSAT